MTGRHQKNFEALVIANAGGTFGSQDPTFPEDAVQRAQALSSVTDASATTNLSEVIAVPTQGGDDYYQSFPVPVRASDVRLPQVLEVPMLDGRWLSSSSSVAGENPNERAGRPGVSSVPPL